MLAEMKGLVYMDCLPSLVRALWRGPTVALSRRPTRTRVWSSKIVGTRCDGKSQREGGRLQQVLGGAAGVASFGRHASRAATLAVQMHGRTRRYDSRDEPCVQRRSAKPRDGGAYATRVKRECSLAGQPRRADERR
jgi:hypothetical protein